MRPFLLCVASAAAGTLELTGGQSFITFDNAATLTATCAGSSPSIQSVTPPNPYGYVQGGPVFAVVALVGVAKTCVDIPLTVPCVAHSERVPPLWSCTYIADGLSAAQGPLSAYLEKIELNVSGTSIVGGFDVLLDCPPPPDSILGLGIGTNVTVGVSYRTTSIAYGGVAGGARGSCSMAALS